MFQKALLVSTALLILSILTAFTDDSGDAIFNGRDITGWKLLNPAAKDSWTVVSEVSLDPANDTKLVSKPGDGVLLRADVAHGSDIYSEREFGNCEVHVEFLIPKGSNSGVYLMGQYEVQIFDSSGTPDDNLRSSDCGGIYSVKSPLTNACKPPGQWQAYDIVFRALRIDPAGKKVENAKFISVKLNDKTIQENVEVPAPTGGQLPGGERATGPLMFQGNHGIAAIRNVRVKPL